MYKTLSITEYKIEDGKCLVEVHCNVHIVSYSLPRDIFLKNCSPLWCISVSANKSFLITWSRILGGF